MKNTLNWIEEGNYEKELWSEGIFVFDSSSLLNFYEYSENTRREIYKTILKKIKGRLWITNQTEYEYLKNRESVLIRPKRSYDELLTTYFNTKQFQTFSNQYKQLKNRTKKGDKHPFIEESFFQEFDKEIETFENKLEAFTERLKKEIETKKVEIDKIKQEDTIHLAFNKFFQVGKGYDYNKLSDIVKEGEFRYRNSIPPGYEDKSEKIGFQIYGDLIIWKQILDIAKDNLKPVILIIDDLKIDWCYTSSKNMIASPREELIKEMLDIGGVKFWAYSSTQFLQKSNELLGTLITDKIIREVKSANQFNINSIVEEIVYKWAISYFENSGKVEFVGNNSDYGVDLLLNKDSLRIGIEIKFYPTDRLQSIKNLVERLNPRFLHRGYFENFDEIMLIIACEDKALACKMDLSKIEYEKGSISPINIKIGFINEHYLFELLGE